MEPVTRAIIWSAFVSIAEESAAVIERTAHSQVVREAADFSTAIFDARGRMLGQGAHSVGHLGSMNFALRHIVERFPLDQLADGDVICFNDPAIGAGHLPDIYVIAPLFHEDALVGFAANAAHHVDVGGSNPGSMGIVGVTELVQEGLFLPPVLLYRRNRPVEDVFTIIAANSRAPEAIRGDLEAQVAGLFAARERATRLYRAYGTPVVEEAAAALFDWTEREMRDGLRAVPDGVYRASDWIDGWGPGTPRLRLAVTVTITGDQARIDFDGTSPQVPAGMNSYYNYTFSYGYFALKCVVGASAPQNDGSLRPVTVTAPEGSLLNPRPGAPCAGRAVLNFRIYELVLQALAQAVPEQVVAPGPQAFNLTFGGTDPRTQRPFVCYELLLGNFGGRPDSDGPDGLTSIVNTANVSVEVNEQRYPIRVDRVELMTDRFGPGRFRSSLPVRRDYRMLCDDVTFTNGTDRHASAPPGLHGGHDGVPGETVLIRAGVEEQLDSKGTYRLRAGDVVSIRPAGGGGYGEPAERAPEAVDRDLEEGLISRAAATRGYPHTGVRRGAGR